ncbi:MAG TPA: hypothetical protein VH500_13315 [Nitrososphaeraceae archaeon]
MHIAPEDPTCKWRGSYNERQRILLKFFKWLYNSEEQNAKARLTPPWFVYQWSVFPVGGY